jgi:hypothetical protein
MPSSLRHAVHLGEFAHASRLAQMLGQDNQLIPDDSFHHSHLHRTTIRDTAILVPRCAASTGSNGPHAVASSTQPVAALLSEVDYDGGLDGDVAVIDGDMGGVEVGAVDEGAEAVPDAEVRVGMAAVLAWLLGVLAGLAGCCVAGSLLGVWVGVGVGDCDLRLPPGQKLVPPPDLSCSRLVSDRPVATSMPVTTSAITRNRLAAANTNRCGPVSAHRRAWCAARGRADAGVGRTVRSRASARRIDRL